MVFKDKLNEIFGMGAPTIAIPQEQPKDVIELTPIEDFRNNIKARLNGIKDGAVMGVVTNAPMADVPPQASCDCGSSSCGSCGNGGVLVERENEIGLDTLKGSVSKLGPKGVSEIIAKLSAEKNEVDKQTGIATSQFDKFVAGLKQEACEALLGSESTPTSAPTPDAGEASGDGTPEAPKSPEQKLPDLVKTSL